MTEIDDAVRAWAKGVYATEAGIELLIRQGKAIYENAPWVTTADRGELRTARVDTDVLLEGTGAWSGGEQRIVRIAVSLLGGPPVDLADEIPGLDRKNAALVLAAIAHANGSHQHVEITFDDEGRAHRAPNPGSLFPWPGADTEP